MTDARKAAEQSDADLKAALDSLRILKELIPKVIKDDGMATTLAISHLIAARVQARESWRTDMENAEANNVGAGVIVWAYPETTHAGYTYPAVCGVGGPISGWRKATSWKYVAPPEGTPHA